MTPVGFEPTPFRNGALSHRLRPLGQSVSGGKIKVQDIYIYIYIYIFGHLIYQRSHMQMGGSLPTANAGSKCLRLYSNWSNMMWNLHELVPRSHTPCCSLHPEPWTPEAKALRPIQICRVNLFSGSCWQVHLTDRLALIIFVLACPNARCVHGQTLMSWCGLHQQCRNIA